MNARSPRSLKQLCIEVADSAIALRDDLCLFCTFIRNLRKATLDAIRHPRKIRRYDVYYYMDNCGSDAMPIIALLGFLIGVILGFQAIVQLRRFGVESYVVNLVGTVIVTELAPLVTAVVLAGRTGSSFAAELGTMKADEEIDAIRKTLPELPGAMRARFVAECGLTEYDAEVLTADRSVAAWFDQAAKLSKSPKLVANWIISELLRLLGEEKVAIDECKITPATLAELVDLIENKTINGKIGKEVFAEMFATGKAPAAIVKEKGLVQVSDSGAIAQVVTDAINANPAQVEQYKAGNAKVLQFLVGQVMKLSKGKANPQLVIAELKKQLD